MSVTETPPRADAFSVTSPGALDKTTPAARCHQCRAWLIHRYRFMGINARTNYRKGARYCSNACRQKAYRARNGAVGRG